jgi:hypothetical protein
VRLRKARRSEEFTATELADEDLRRIAPLHPVFRISQRP